jgi:hypothetical protein
MIKNTTWTYSPQKNEQFLFLHIPKTAGTTFRHMLTKHFDKEDVYPTDFHLMINNGKYIKQKILIENRKDLLQKPLIMGHYNVRLIPHLKPEAKTIIFLRDPLERIKSHVKHIIQKEPNFQDGDPNKIIEARFEMLTNLQARILGFTKRRPNLPEVLENLEKITFIGLTEDFDTSIKKINKQFGWQLEYNNEKKNTSSKQINLKITPDIITQIQEKIQPEIAAYNRAKEIFFSKS